MQGKSDDLEGKQDIVRMSFQLTRELSDKLNDLVPWGLRGQFITKIVSIALERMDIGGYAVLGAIVRGDYDPLTGEVKEVKEEGDGSKGD